MTKQETQLTQIGIRLAPAQMRQLMLLAAFHGGQTRTVVTALDRLFQAELTTNPAFADWVAEEAAEASPAIDDAADSDG